MERKHQEILTSKANELAKGIHLNHGDLLGDLVSDGVISLDDVQHVSDEAKKQRNSI
jgi:hypothetical protein